MANDTQVVMQIPQEVISAQVKAAVAATLAKDPEALIRAVVEAAMTQKRESYDRQTIWDQKVNEMIRLEAEATFKGWLEENKLRIRTAVLQRLKKREEFIGQIADKLVDKLQSSFRLAIYIEKDE